MRSVLNLYPAWFNEPEVLRRQILLRIYEKLGCSETIVGKHSHPAKHSWDHLTSVRPHAFATIQCVLLSLACCAYSAIWHIEACVIGSCVSPRSADPFLGSSDGGVEQTACFRCIAFLMYYLLLIETALCGRSTSPMLKLAHLGLHCGGRER